VAPRGRDDPLFSCLDAISAFPARESERQWLLRFTTILGDHLKKAYEVEPHVFLEFKTATAVNDEFLRNSRKFMPLAGLGRHPGAVMPAMPSDQKYKELMEGKASSTLRTTSPTIVTGFWFRPPSASANCSRVWGACRLPTGSPIRRPSRPISGSRHSIRITSCFKSSM